MSCLTFVWDWVALCVFVVISCVRLNYVVLCVFVDLSCVMLKLKLKYGKPRLGVSTLT